MKERPIAVYGAIASNLLIAEDQSEIFTSRRPLTMHLSPDNVLVNLDVEFRDDLDAEEIRRVIERLEAAIRGEHPEIRKIFIEARAVDR